MTADLRAFSSCSSTRSPPAVVRPRPNLKQLRPGWNEPSNALYDRTRPYLATASRKPISWISQMCGVSQPWLTLQSLVFAVIFAVLFCCQGVEADRIHVASSLEGRAELLFDRSEPPVPPMRLHRRQETSTSLPPSIAAPTISSTSSGTASSSSRPVTISTAVPTSQSPLPSPFDSSLGNNFTTPSCPTFFHGFLTNSTFRQCRPLSLLLQTSKGFFEASRSVVQLTQTLDATCSVDFNQCAAVMASFAQQIQLDSNCGADLRMQNPMVEQAFNGFVAYPTLYRAGCLTDQQGSYCFADAVTNASAPTSSYIYYLPLGVQLPAGTQPACNPCLQNTMSIFASIAGNSSQPLAKDYGSAAQQVDMTCGPSYVQASAQRTSAAATASLPSVGLAIVTFLMMLVLM